MEKRRQKPLNELTLLDKFLFDEVMEDAESVKVLLDIIFDQNTEVKYPPQTEKEQRTATKNRGIRLDVYTMDEEDVIYNLEAQRKNTKNLPKIELLHYMEETTDQVAQASKSEKIQKLHERVKKIRMNEELEVKYMQTWEEKAMEREEGRREGERKGRREIIEKMRESLSVKEIAQLLGMEEDVVKNTVKEKETKPE